MLRNFFFCLFVVMLAALCTDARRKLPGGKRTSCESFGRKNSSRAICIVQHGQSGKISISLGKDRGENDPKTITIEFDAVREVDADGNQVGKTGAKEGKHSFENFANLEFEFSDLVNTSYQGIKAVGFNFSAKIPGPNATLTIPVYIFKENKTIALCDGETEIDVVRRMVKFNIELSNWNFCKAGSGCRKGQKEEIGKYMDFVITVKNKGKGKEGTKKKKQPGKKHKAQKFFFGNNSISFPSTFSSDGDCTKKMPADFPRLKSRGGDKYSITFRFPTFNDKIVYDPAVDMEEQESPPDDSGDDSGTKLLYPSFGLVVILGVFARLFF